MSATAAGAQARAWARAWARASSAASLWTLAAAGLAHPGAAQDIEMESVVRGRALPPAYFDRIATRPDFFSVARGWTGRVAGPASRGIPARAPSAAIAGPTTGTLRLLLVPALFRDSPAPPVSTQAIQARLFDGPNPAGTVTDFYGVSSGGRLTVTGTVAPWVRTNVSVAEARAQSFGLGADAGTGRWLVEALTQVDAAIDFRQFDNDGPDGNPDSGDDDGFVDAVAIEFLEAPLTCQGQGPTIWAHRATIAAWTDSSFATQDVGASGAPIRVDDYIVQAAVRCNGSVQSAVTIVHELGHILGLPDLYDRTEGSQPWQRSWVVGCWSIMAAGQWGCGEALARGRWDRPPHLGPWEKRELGWIPGRTVVGDVLDAEYVLRPVEGTEDVLEVPLSPTEALLIEYRDGSGFDRNLPATGVLIHHVDSNAQSNGRRCRGCPQRYLAALLEADANGSLTTPEGEGGNRGEPGDIFSGSGPHRVTNVTVPSTRLNSGAPSSVSIYSISIEDGLARVRLSTRVVPAERLLDGFFDGASPLSDEERAYLDRVGNADGTYDIGDLARYVREHPILGGG